MIAALVHYYSNALDPPTARAAIITGPGAGQGEWNVAVLLDQRMDVRKGNPAGLQRIDLAIIPAGAPKPPGVREWLVDHFGLVLDPSAKGAEQAPPLPPESPSERNGQAEKPVETLNDPPKTVATKELSGALAQITVPDGPVVWENATPRSYRGLSATNGMPVFILTMAGSRAHLYAADHTGARGEQLEAGEIGEIPRLLELAVEQYQPIFKANMEHATLEAAP